MSDDVEAPRVPIVCPACETTTAVPVAKVGEALARHNDRLHDGRAVAEVDPAIRERVADLAAADLGLVDDG
ncbi:MAG: hypothetical protein ABEJ81_02695 [Haloferacaceae archaeon]